jgi:hypothetical protein
LFLAPGEGGDASEAELLESKNGSAGRGDAALSDAIRLIRGQSS